MIDVEDSSGTRRMMEDNLRRVPESDRIVLLKIFSSTSDTAYGDALQGILPNIVARWGLSDEGAYAEAKLGSIKVAMKELWVKLARKFETFRIFEDFEAFEKVLFQSNPEYRGHYVHQFDVYLLGYYLLNRILNTKCSAAERFKESTNPNFTWLLAATFHDMGYPIEQIDSWLSAFLKVFLKVDTTYPIEIERILTPVFFDYLRYISEMHYNLMTERIAPSGHSPVTDWAFHNELETALRKKNHGVISSVLLIHSFFTREKVTQSQNWFYETFPLEVLPACHAMALHSLESNGMKASLAKCPYAFLLQLCDTIQDWQRSLGRTDYSELKRLDFSMKKKTPNIEFVLQINEEKKIEELNQLGRKMETDGLIRIDIRQSNGRGHWILK
jgi:hypothetical protein